jgi:SOS-response transcriptional repressor LexA
MDKDWFKRRLRMQGKTADDLAKAISRDRAVVSRILNGHQQLTLDQAKIFATELDAEVGDVLLRSGLTEAPMAQALSPGFAESDAAPWVAGPDATDTRHVPSVAQALGGGRPGVDVWRVKGLAMALHGLLEGDFMLVDTHQAERARAGDTVVAQVYNPRGATTVLRTYAPPVLMSSDPNDLQVHVVDGVNVVIRGKVVASWRA